MRVQLQFVVVYLPALLTSIGFLLPNLSLTIKLYIVGVISVIYFFIVSICLLKQLKKSKSESAILKQAEEKLNVKLQKYESFRNKRDLFINHDLSQIEKILTEYDGYLKDSYREKKYQDMKLEYKLVRTQVSDIITKEKRAYDEQLFDVQSNKDNWWV